MKSVGTGLRCERADNVRVHAAADQDAQSFPALRDQLAQQRCAVCAARLLPRGEDCVHAELLCRAQRLVRVAADVERAVERDPAAVTAGHERTHALGIERTVRVQHADDDAVRTQTGKARCLTAEQFKLVLIIQKIACARTQQHTDGNIDPFAHHAEQILVRRKSAERQRGAQFNAVRPSPCCVYRRADAVCADLEQSSHAHHPFPSLFLTYLIKYITPQRYGQ